MARSEQARESEVECRRASVCEARASRRGPSIAWSYPSVPGHEQTVCVFLLVGTH